MVDIGSHHLALQTYQLQLWHISTQFFAF